MPWLVGSGFHQPIYCTEATAELVPLMLEDGLKLQLGLSNKEVQYVLNQIDCLLRPQPYNQWFSIDPEAKLPLKARFQPAGHILGSSYIEVQLGNGEIIVFSGDLGPSDTPLLPTQSHLSAPIIC